jgi:hypothetical protein
MDSAPLSKLPRAKHHGDAD